MRSLQCILSWVHLAVLRMLNDVRDLVDIAANVRKYGAEILRRTSFRSRITSLLR